jgi:toxin ParE1/3/4
MAKLIWSIDSIDDMNEIGDYIAESSAGYAAFLITEFLKCEKILTRFPKIGRIMPEIGINSIREIIVHNYRIIYFVDQDNSEVKILRVQHGSKPLKNVKWN